MPIKNGALGQFGGDLGFLDNGRGYRTGTVKNMRVGQAKKESWCHEADLLATTHNSSCLPYHTRCILLTLTQTSRLLICARVITEMTVDRGLKLNLFTMQ
jgi:hypothetical protein